MPLTKFVRNVSDLSDDGGYKFRFCCDQCGDGFESQYVSSSTNILKTGLDVFQMLKPFGGMAGNLVNDVDRGLRGKEHDAAYERAAAEAMAFFLKCPKCGHWVCPEQCWNAEAALCVTCAPGAEVSAAAGVAKAKADVATAQAMKAGAAAGVVCPVCQKRTPAGKFCTACGTALMERKCAKCAAALGPSDHFCSGCGAKA